MPTETPSSDVEGSWSDGFEKGYDMGARGHLPTHAILVALPDNDPDRHEHVRARLQQVLEEEGLLPSSIVEIDGQ